MKIAQPELKYSMESPSPHHEFIANIYSNGEIATRLWRLVPATTIAVCVVCGESYPWRRATDQCRCMFDV